MINVPGPLELPKLPRELILPVFLTQCFNITSLCVCVCVVRAYVHAKFDLPEVKSLPANTMAVLNRSLARLAGSYVPLKSLILFSTSY